MKIVAGRRSRFVLVFLGKTETALCVTFWLNSLEEKIGALKTENCLLRAPQAKTIALRAIVFSLGAFWKLLKTTVCWLRASVWSCFFFWQKKRGVTHGQEIVERTANKEAHSKCLQLVVCKQAKRLAEKLHFSGVRDQGSLQRGS